MKRPSDLARRMFTGAVLALCAASAIPAAPSLYTVEILVFRSAGTAGAMADNEVLPVFTDDGIDITPAATGRLNAAAARLRGSRAGFEVLAHAAWTQGPAAFSARLGIPVERLGLGNGIVGKVALLRDRVLSLQLDLTIEEGGRRYRINQRESMRPNEVRYFDHPSMGVLAVISAAPG
jgi:hypothetical protein